METQNLHQDLSPSTRPASHAFRLEDLSKHSRIKLWSLVFDLPGEKVNKLSRKVMTEFEALLPKLEELATSQSVDVLVLSSAKPGVFIAGADIEMFQGLRSAEEAQELSRMGQKLMSRWEDLPFVKVA